MAEIVTRLAPRGIIHETSKPTLELEHVSVAFGGGGNGAGSGGQQYALKDVSFAVNRTERIAIVGPNGSGKTTLFRVIVGTVSSQRKARSMFTATSPIGTPASPTCPSAARSTGPFRPRSRTW